MLIFTISDDIQQEEYDCVPIMQLVFQWTYKCNMELMNRFFRRELIIDTKNPYDGKQLNGYAAQINGWWKSEYTELFIKKGVKHLFLNTALGWRCDNYDFLTSLPSIETLVLVEEREMSLKRIESLKKLRNLEISTPYCYDIDFSIFKHLESLFCSAERPIPSVFQCTSLKELYLDEFKLGDKHQLSQLLNLESLTIGYSNLTNLNFLHSLPDLKKLTLYNNRLITDFSPISTLIHLNWIDLRGLKNLHTIDFLEGLKKLNVLLLESGAIGSIHPIRNHQELKAISLTGSKFHIIDGDLTPISTLSNLSMLFINNRKTYNAYINNLWNWDNYGKPRYDWLSLL